MRELDFGSIISRAFDVLAKNAVPFAILAFLFVGLPSWLLRGEWLSGSVLEKGLWIGPGLSSLILMAGQAMLQAAVMFGVYRTLKGQPADLTLTISRGVQSLIPVLLVSLLSSLLIGLGFILLIIPGIILSVLFLTVVPVAVVERLGPLKALDRAVDLAGGHFWMLFGYVLLIWVLSWLASWLLGVIFSIVGLGALAGGLAAAAVAAFNAVAVTVIYADLKSLKDGVPAETLYQVFD